MRLANDGKCFVLSEAIDGAAAPPADLDRSRPDVVFGATLGTGVGGGIVVDGRVLTGENGAATEWSHTTLPFLRAGRARALRLRLRPRRLHRVVHLRARRCRRGTARSAAATSTAPRSGGGRRRATPSPRRRSRSTRTALARALAMVVNMLDPRAIVLGGGVSNNARIFAQRPEAVGALDGPEGPAHASWCRAAHGDASGVRGAALLWPLAR